MLIISFNYIYLFKTTYIMCVILRDEYTNNDYTKECYNIATYIQPKICISELSEHRKWQNKSWKVSAVKSSATHSCHYHHTHPICLTPSAVWLQPMESILYGLPLRCFLLSITPPLPSPLAHNHRYPLFIGSLIRLPNRQPTLLLSSPIFSSVSLLLKTKLS